MSVLNNKINFDNISNIRIDSTYTKEPNENIPIITPKFKSDVSSRKDLILFWIVPVKSNSDGTLPRFVDELDTPELYGYKLRRINVDRFTEDIYLVDFSVEGIEDIKLDQDSLDDYSFQLDKFKYWVFYYRDSSSSKYYRAFNILISGGAVNAEEVTRNILLLDLSILKPRFNFHQAYSYNSEVAIPLYQHYHKTNIPKNNDEYMSNNVLDGNILKSKLIEYINSRNSLINNESRTEYNESYISNNYVHIIYGDKEFNRKILVEGTESKFTYATENGHFTPNANLFNAFDNTEENQSDPKYDKFPLITLYGIDSVANINELKLDWSLLVYELEDPK